MLRELQTHNGKVCDAMNTASVAMVVGMGVIKDYTKNEVKFPSSATATGIYFVTKEKIPESVYASKADYSDYEDMFMNIKANEKVKLIVPMKGERYATDQLTPSVTVSETTTTVAVGDYLNLGTDGKFTRSASATRIVYRGTKKIDNHELHVVEFID